MSTSKLGEINQLFAVSIGLVYNITKNTFNLYLQNDA